MNQKPLYKVTINSEAIKKLGLDAQAVAGAIDEDMTEMNLDYFLAVDGVADIERIDNK